MRSFFMLPVSNRVTRCLQGGHVVSHRRRRHQSILASYRQQLRRQRTFQRPFQFTSVRTLRRRNEEMATAEAASRAGAGAKRATIENLRESARRLTEREARRGAQQSGEASQ